MAKVAHANSVRAALKFQFRQLDSFIHPTHQEGSTNKHIPRFLSTRLSVEESATLAEQVRKQELITMSTPFDEESVDLLVDLGIEVAKVASCSARDWPLLEKIAECGKPVIFSTGGLGLKEIDDLVSFFDHRGVHFAIMHCVAIYPTPVEKLELNQIRLLKARYPGKIIGFSTHENPDDTDPVKVAVARGGEIFERHVGVETEKFKLNAYSSSPAQIDRWLKAYNKAKVLSGREENRPTSAPEETESLQSLERGVYASKPLKQGVIIPREDVYFSMPVAEDQLSSGQWKKGIVSRSTVSKDKPLHIAELTIPPEPPSQRIYTALHEVKALLNEARIALPLDFKLEISHHYGMSNFDEVGAVLIDCVNRSYCKKLVVQIKGQRHPNHYHKRKEETFQVCHGVLRLELDGRRRILYPGDIVLILPGVWHEFWTDTGVVFEEISSTHYNDDSYYENKDINRMKRSERKTVVDYWGRHQI